LYPAGYDSGVLAIVWSHRFRAWIHGLADQKARARIAARLDRASLGNFGDCKPVGEGVSEMRIDVGPGYRVYFARQGAAVYVLLTGGDKSSQERDIVEAKAMARELKGCLEP
jgi:putative addiction module killer protein